jgi:hypothetical protein
MPRASTIAQADIARTLRAFRGLGIEAEVRILPDGTVIVGPVTSDGKQLSNGRFDKEAEIRL